MQEMRFLFQFFPLFFLRAGATATPRLSSYVKQGLSERRGPLMFHSIFDICSHCTTNRSSITWFTW